MKLENTGKSLSDLASLLTERSSSGKEKGNEAAKADFDPLHPFKARKKRSASVPAGAKPLFPKEGASGLGALARLRTESETAVTPVPQKSEKKASSLYKTPVSRPTVKAAHTEPAKPVLPDAREAKRARAEESRDQAVRSERKASGPKPDQAGRAGGVSGASSERRAQRGHPVPEIKEHSGKVSDTVPEAAAAEASGEIPDERCREAVPSGAEAGRTSQKTEAASPPCRSEDGCRQARSDAGQESGPSF